MKIEDLNLKIGDKLPFDVIEDLMVYMQNDPMFYRRHMYPKMIDVQEAVKGGGKVNKKDLIPMIDHAIASYVKKFNINKRPADLLTTEEKMECISKLLKNEVDNFRKGMY